MKAFIRQCYFYAAWFFTKLVLLLPYRFAVSLGGWLGLAGYYIAGKARNGALDNIFRAFPAYTPAQAQQLVRQVFINQGKNAFELFSYPKLTAADLLKIATVENKEHLTRALADGKGVLIASAHCGNWEILGAALAAEGFSINVIAKRIYIEGLNDLLVGFRESKQVKVILRSDAASAKQMLRALRNNESIGMLIDQDTAVSGVFVPFFGRDAYTPSGVASLAIKTGARIVLALDIRNPDDTHTVRIEGPFELPTVGTEEERITEITRMICARTEAHIRQYPAQWVWMHDRWKTRAAQ